MLRKQTLTTIDNSSWLNEVWESATNCLCYGWCAKF